MANHFFVTIQGGSISGGKLDKLLHEIVSTKWDDLITVSRGGRLIRPEESIWEIHRKSSVQIQVELRSPRKISLRPGCGVLTGWVIIFITESLAKRLNGMCSGEGTRNRWKGEPEAWSTHKKWFAESWIGQPAEEIHAAYERFRQLGPVKFEPQEIFCNGEQP